MGSTTYPPPFRAFITTHPKDLIDFGLEDALDRLHGEIGVDGLTLWAVTPQVTTLRAINVESRIFQSEGGLLFHPNKARYDGTRCKPVVAACAKGKDLLELVSTACRNRHISLRAMVSATHCGQLAEKHPEFATKNVFGLKSATTLCLINPDVQMYLGTIISELSTTYPVDRLCLVDLDPKRLDAIYPSLNLPPFFGDAERSLLSICFCESCYQRAAAAGIDALAARRFVHALLEKSMMRGTAESTRLESVLADAPTLTSYLGWRREALNTWLVRTKKVCHCDFVLAPGASLCEKGLADNRFDSKVADILLLEPPDLTDLDSVFADEPAGIELVITPSIIAHTPGNMLVSGITRAAELGYAGIDVHEFAFLSEQTLAFLKQAIRFAKRSVSR